MKILVSSNKDNCINITIDPDFSKKTLPIWGELIKGILVDYLQNTKVVMLTYDSSKDSLCYDFNYEAISEKWIANYFKIIDESFITTLLEETEFQTGQITLITGEHSKQQMIELISNHPIWVKEEIKPILGTNYLYMDGDGWTLNICNSKDKEGEIFRQIRIFAAKNKIDIQF